MTRYTKSMREAMLEVWANDITLDEGNMKTIATMFAQGKSAEEIAAKMTLPVATVKTILGEDDVKEQMLWEFTDAQITKLKKDYASLKGTKISLARANQLRNIFDKITDTQLPKLYKADIPFLSTMSLSRMIKKGIQVPKGVRISAFREQTWEEILKDENAIAISGIETSPERTQLDEKFQPGFAVRYALDGKRKVQAYKTQKDADHRAKILKSMGGVKDVSITKHDLNFKEEDFKVFNEYAEYIEYMAKNSGQAKAIANMFKGKTGGGESKADGSEVRIDSAKDVENIHKQVIAKYGDDVRVLTKEEFEVIAVKPFRLKGKDVKVGQRIGPKMSYNQAIAQVKRMNVGQSVGGSRDVEARAVREDVKETIQPYLISYSKQGDHYGFEGGDNLADIQNKAQKLRAKGFTIDKMGKYNPPVDKKLMTGKTGVVNDMTPADLDRLKKQGFKPKTESIDGDVAPKKTFAGFKKENSKDKETDIDKIKLAKEKDTDTLDAQVTTLKGQLGLIKQKLEIEKNKVVKPVPDKETGEVPLAIGLAQKLLRDKAQKETKKESVEEGKVKDYLMDVEQDAGEMDLNKLIRKYYGTMGLTADAIKKIYYRVNEDVKVKFAMNKDQKIATATYKDKKSAKDFIKSILSKGGKAILGEATLVQKAKDIAKKMADNLTGAVKAIEKLQKGLSKNSSVEQALKTANESIKEAMPGGANSSSRKGKVFRKWFKTKMKKNYMKKSEFEPKGKDIEEAKPKKKIEHKNHPAKKKWEALTAKQKKIDLNKNGKVDGKDLAKLRSKKEDTRDDNSKTILPNYQEPTQKTDPMNIQTKEPEKKKTDNGTKSDKIDVNPRIDYQA
jgi:hypothetical protein